MGGLKVKLSMKVVCLGDRTGRRWLIGATKQPERLAAVTSIGCKNSITGGNYGSTDGHEGYELIASYKVVLVVYVRWSGVRQILACGKPKW